MIQCDNETTMSGSRDIFMITIKFVLMDGSAEGICANQFLVESQELICKVLFSVSIENRT